MQQSKAKSFGQKYHKSSKKNEFHDFKVSVFSLNVSSEERNFFLFAVLSEKRDCEVISLAVNKNTFSADFFSTE